MDTDKEIDELKKKLVEYQQALKDIEIGIKDLKSKNHSDIGTKEKELEDWRTKLETCQQERNQIRKEIKDKRLELEQSNLSNTEKQTKINELLTENIQELEEIDKLLYDERSQYRSIRDKVINELLKPCSVCEAKEKNINNLQERFNGLKIWTILIFLSAIFWCFLFLGKVFRKKKKKKQYVVSMLK